MSFFGDIGETLQIHIAKPEVCATPSEYNPDDLIDSLRFTIASNTQQIGIDTISGSIVWYPTSMNIPCQSPAFVVLNKVYGVYTGSEDSFFLNISGTTREWQYQKTPQIEPDERIFRWIGEVEYNSNTYNTMIQCINEPSGLPASLKLSISCNEKDWDDFGIKYILYPQVPITLYSFLQTGTTVNYLTSDGPQIIPSSNLDEFITEFYTLGAESKALGHFDFTDIFEGATSKYIAIEWVTMPDTVTSGLCLVVGSTKGPLHAGEVYSIDPQLGNNVAATSYSSWSWRVAGIRFYASSESDTITGLQLNSMTVYGRSSTGTKDIEGAIYSCNAMTSSAMNFLYSTNRGTQTTTATWRTLPFSDPKPVLISGTMYYMVWGASGTSRYYYTARPIFGITGAKGWSDAADWFDPFSTATMGLNNAYFAMYLDYTPVGLQSTKATKVGAPTEWGWGTPILGVDSSQVAESPSGLIWDWKYVGNAGTRWVQRSGSDATHWSWVQESN
jgi:hypothetical protein